MLDRIRACMCVVCRVVVVVVVVVGVVVSVGADETMQLLICCHLPYPVPTYTFHSRFNDPMVNCIFCNSETYCI